MISAAEAKELAKMTEEMHYQNTIKRIEKSIKTMAEAGGDECHFGALPLKVVDLLKDLGYDVIVNDSQLGSETIVTW